MLVACDTRCFGPHPLDAAFREIRAAGLQRVELPLTALAAIAPGSPAVDRADLLGARQLLDDLGLQAVAVHIGGLAEGESPAQLARRMDDALELGSSLVVADAGQTAGESPSDPFAPRLRRLVDAAEERGLTVAIDMLPGLRCDAREMLRLLRELDRPALRLCFDTGAYVAQHPGSGEVALQRVCTHLGAVRLRDATGSAGEDDYPPLGQGAAVDFTRTREVLEAIAFRGPCTISFTLRRRRTPPTIEECRAGLTRSLAQLHRGGWFEGGRTT